MENLKRVGNWYQVKVGENTYQVLIQKDENSISCDPSSVLVFNDTLIPTSIQKLKEWSLVFDPMVLEEIDELMRKMDWEYDLIDE